MMSKLLFVLATSFFGFSDAVYKLKYIGGAAVGGGVDTDSAEHMAFDSTTNTAFIAGADAITLKAYDISNPTAPVLTRTLNVQEAAEDECSTPVYAKSVQSVAVVNVANYGTTVIAAAVVSRDRLTNGALIFYKGDTLEYLDCQPTGVGPESIVSDGTSKIVVANEGFDGRTEAFDGTVNPDGTANYEFTSGDMQDPVGSITVCTATASSSTSISFSCLDRDLRPSYVTGDESYCTGCSDSGCTAVADRIASYQASGIRLFGPGLLNSGDIFSAVMEPEGIAITDDGAYIMCVFQDNNAYGIYDVSAQKWKKLGGLGTIEMTMDPSDRDDAINIRNSWGSDNTRAYGMHMPDAVATFTHGGTYYFVTANEGDTKDCSTQIIGNQTWTEDQCEDNVPVFEGEDVRLGDLQLSCADCGTNSLLGRVGTSPYMPSNWAADLCPTFTCGTGVLKQTCQSTDFTSDTATTYSTTVDNSNTDGAPGGVYTIGSRSITIWSWDGTNDLVRVWDSGSKFEMITGGGDVTITPEDLCGPCLANGGSDCDDCPFNSDRAPPSFERRSDNKGPEPESVTVATLDDGTRLVFTGLERTGGIVTYDITDPTAPVYQDFLNVRNWKVNDPSIYDDAYYYLNDGPEHLVYVQPSDSPIGQPLLLAAHPYYGRFSIYMIESGAARTSDGSCSSTATCGYIPTSLGGTGALLPDICDIVTSAYESTFNCESSSSSDDSTLAVAIAVPLAIVLLIAGGIAAYCAFSMGKQSGYEKAKELKEQEFALKGPSKGSTDAASVRPSNV